MTPTPEVRRRRPVIDARIERQIITGMIISDRFIKEVKPLIAHDSFRADYIGRVAEWCLEYHDVYKKAPGRYIEDLFLQHKDRLGEDEAKFIGEFLAEISDEHERAHDFNDDYILGKAENHFRLCALKILQDKITQLVILGQMDEAEKMVKEYRRPARLRSQGVDPLRDVEAIVSALSPESENKKTVLRLPGDLGEAVGPLERGFFVAIQAESGVGKTWWLWFMAKLAVLSGHNTIFFSMEMSTNKMIERIWQSVSGAPSEEVPSHLLGRHGELLIPVFDCEKNQRNECSLQGRRCRIGLVGQDEIAQAQEGERSIQTPSYLDAPAQYHPCSVCRGQGRFKPTSWWSPEELVHTTGEIERVNRGVLDPGIALAKHAALDRSGMFKRSGQFKLFEYPSRRHTMDDLLNEIENLEYYDGFIPSVIITDYADKLKFSVKGDPRVSIGEIWDGHKALAQAKNCLVITASQSNTMRSGKAVGRGSWGETQEKEHLLDIGIALNQSAQEQAAGIMRASLAKKRHGQTERAEEVMVLQSLSIGMPYVDSCRIVRGKEDK